MLNEAIITGATEQDARNYMHLCGIRQSELAYDQYRDYAAWHHVSQNMMEGVARHSVTNSFFRPRSYDHQFFSEQHFHDLCKIQDMDRVLDIGGNCGLYAVYAANFGAQVVCTVEPSQDNMTLIRANLADKGSSARVITVRAACVPSNYLHPSVVMSMNRGAGKGMHSLVARRGRTDEVVPAVRLADLMATVVPTVVKLDIEGGEYLFAEDLQNIPAHVRAIFVEFHLTRKEWRTTRASALYETLTRQFRVAHAPTPFATSTRWSDYFVGIR